MIEVFIRIQVRFENPCDLNKNATFRSDVLFSNCRGVATASALARACARALTHIQFVRRLRASKWPTRSTACSSRRTTQRGAQRIVLLRQYLSGRRLPRFTIPGGSFVSRICSWEDRVHMLRTRNGKEHMATLDAVHLDDGDLPRSTVQTGSRAVVTRGQPASHGCVPKLQAVDVPAFD
eukprot:gene23970-biopygen20864